MKKQMIAAVVGVGLLTGGVGVAGAAAAHDREETPAAHPVDRAADPGGDRRAGPEGRLRGPGRPGAPLESVAEALSLPVATVQQGLRDGKSVAQLADENGVAVDAVIDALTADARERITDMVNRVPGEKRAAP